MRCIFIKKKYFYAFFLFIILCIIAFWLCKHSPSFAIDITDNSIVSSSLQAKFDSLNSCDEKVAYLTFDDGPTIKATPKILDILKEEDIKASFFVIGKYVKNHPDIVKREYEEGHYIANHGYDHNNSKLYASSESFINEVKSTDLEIGKAIGDLNYCSHIFRFPNGYTYVDWNCLNRDSERKTSNYQLLNNLKKSSKNKGTLVVLMHDTADVNNSSEILKESISYLKSEGYQFKNFYDLLE